MEFTKMHGIGNDYVYINCFKESVKCPGELAKWVSDRHKGIGSDGLVLIMPSDKADFRMRMFNPDGSESQMCGNAARCVGKYVYDNGLTDKTSISLETKAGIKHLLLFPEKGKIKTVCVDMGEPVLRSSDIPVIHDEERLIDCLVDFSPEQYRITCVSMGNPHTIIFVESTEELALETIGKKIESFRLFPERTNVEFVEILSPHEARVRVWERGTGETQACGTGACAVVVAGVLTGRLERKATINLPGGELLIEWRNDNHVYMTGDAVTVYTGCFSTD
ncbi:diaminopimelate epimerase [Bacteroides sp. UBA939]|uniref:diaminopimelate epimerase n=1 Tax=Bacteroides sp. UBA939 TaxID=1946092 RepID=UPI0025C1298F|nr:diaminopimelate epimerase [Bacteroides sp. UBA939]